MSKRNLPSRLAANRFLRSLTALLLFNVMLLAGTSWLIAVRGLEADSDAMSLMAVETAEPVMAQHVASEALSQQPQMQAVATEMATASVPVVATAVQPKVDVVDVVELTDQPDYPTFNSRRIRPVRTIRMLVTAYSPDERSCGKWADGITASGYSVWTNGMKLVAADTRILPFGSVITVPGYNGDRPVPVLDRGGKIKGNRLDVLYPTHEIARGWGAKRLDVTVWEYVD